jgi:hypothetical protein
MARAARKSTAVDQFFDEPQGAAKLKHEVLRQHLTIYASKTGRRTPVVFLDGYAGPGRYGDGSPGSPGLWLTLPERSASIATSTASSWRRTLVTGSSSRRC